MTAGGARKGCGRKPREATTAVIKKSRTALEFLARVYNNDELDIEIRIKAAVAAAGAEKAIIQKRGKKDLDQEAGTAPPTDSEWAHLK
jgi:hypothetical protein